MCLEVVLKIVRSYNGVTQCIEDRASRCADSLWNMLQGRLGSKLARGNEVVFYALCVAQEEGEGEWLSGSDRQVKQARGTPLHTTTSFSELGPSGVDPHHHDFHLILLSC